MEQHGPTLDIGSSQIRCSKWAEPHYVTVNSSWMICCLVRSSLSKRFEILNCSRELSIAATEESTPGLAWLLRYIRVSLPWIVLPEVVDGMREHDSVSRRIVNYGISRPSSAGATKFDTARPHWVHTGSVGVYA